MGLPDRKYGLIGQKRIKNYLERQRTGSTMYGRCMRSMLFTGKHGQGKTELAKGLAAEYEDQDEDGTVSSFHLIMGSNVRALTNIISQKLQEANFGDTVFIDEAHSLDRDAQETLFLALDQNKTYGWNERGRMDRSQFVSIADFTLILATSNPGSVLPQLRSRLDIIEFDPYTLSELKAIVESVAQQKGLTFSPQAARHLAERSQASPRYICRSVDLLQTYYPEVSDFSQDHVRAFLNSCGIDDLGLFPKQREYLRALAAVPKGTASLERLGAKIGLDLPYLRRDVEPFLLDSGFIEIATARSRTITPTGRQVVEEAMDTDEGEAL